MNEGMPAHECRSENERFQRRYERLGMDPGTPILPSHIEDAVRSIAELHAEHDRRTSCCERSNAGPSDNLGPPAAVRIIVETHGEPIAQAGLAVP